ncbi:unnamed protein product [Peronospora destructor]|uniref:BTB domain-containing protein n=1 Tax=Peronospora destructor TaxID=86335 RepID=A0AAV0TWP0_9STRA|nr:unnamed protein product [Peronospora destructor]
MTVYVWGQNKSQQLGLNVMDKEVFELMQVNTLRNQVIVEFAAGASHSLALNEFGHVFAWGRGREGQLGLSDVARVAKNIATPRRIGGPLATEVVTKISCGESHSLAVTVSGELFMWGLLPIATKVLHDEENDVSDRAMIELTGLRSDEMPRQTFRNETRHQMDDSIMARLVRDSMRLYEDVDGENGKVQTIRAPCMTPQLCTGPLAKLVVTNSAAGFAHSLATTNEGTQHSLACSSILDSVETKEDLDANTKLRSGVCFSWGLGVLGQLGTGLDISWTPQEVKLARPAVSVAAGSHHSVAVTDDGKVYTWGHSEYGQHGAGETFYDLQHNAHYFFPRVQQALADDPSIRVASACCSSHSTFALTCDGSVMSWGWNAFGVLGNGKYQYSVHPQRVVGLKDNVAVAIANADFADLVFTVRGPKKVERIKAHRVVVSARSSYLRGLLRVLDSAAMNTQGFGANDNSSVKKEENGLFAVDEFKNIDALVFRAFLTFLYTNRLDVASHKRKALSQFASSVCCDALVIQCLDTWRKERLASLPPSSFRRTGQHFTGAQPASFEAQQFEEDMQSMVLSEEVADVVLLWPVENEPDIETYERLPAHKAVLSQVSYFRTMFMDGFSEGDTVQAITTGKQKGSVHEIRLHYMHRDGVSLEAFKGVLLWIYTGCFELLSARLEPSDMMVLYVGASLLGLSVLASRCELQLVGLLPQLDVDSLRACEDFAERYDARRLKTMSHQVLQKQQSTHC